MPPTAVYLALGSNLGDRAANIHSAIEKIAQLENTRVVAMSSLLENPAVGGPENSPSFLNAAALVRTPIDPEVLLQHLLNIEQSLGRHRLQKWEPRPIDLDILVYGDCIIRSQSLIIPHPLMHERLFVLKPLVEIAPTVFHPVLKQTAAQLLARLTPPD